jgi:hypothetical protein
MLVCAFYKLEVPLIPSRHAAEIFVQIVYLVLGLIKTKLLKIIAPQLVILY